MVCSPEQEKVGTGSIEAIIYPVYSDLRIRATVSKSDIYRIKFQLDDEYGSVICEEIIIKRIDGSFVGAEFYHSDRYNYELDFYITAESWDT
jgi:hypothetical protein